MNTPVNYPIAKLLKEKEFNEPSSVIVTNKNKHHLVSDLLRCVPMVFTTANNKGLPDHICSAPTISDVVMWFYEKHGIWIQVCISRYGKFYCNIFKNELTKCLDSPISWETQIQLNDFNSQTEAYEVAFEYTLNKWI